MASFLLSAKNSAMRVVASARESMAPVLKESAFHERGVLTPDEFVLAGDLLVTRCPTWQWCGAPDPAVRVPYLPEGKQYLVTRNIPCFDRVASLTNQDITEEVLGGEDGDGDGVDEGWVSTHIHRDEEGGAGNKGGEIGGGGGDAGEIVIGADGSAMVKQKPQSIFSGVQILDDYDGKGEDDDATAASGNGAPATAEPALPPVPVPVGPGSISPDNGGESSSDDDYDDLSAFEDMSLVQEPDPSSLSAAGQNGSSALPTSDASSGGESKTGGVVRVSEPADTVVQCRRYDISITYDKYYQTPRVWLLGYDERGQPLDQKQIFEDIMQDYANKTVTIEKHPLAERGSSSVHASIHPCKHASTMKKIIDRLNDGDTAGGARVDMYLIIFLKFIQSVVPTMNYDFTSEANIG